ncbi:coiled-coil domain-containing protein 105 [Lampris incognitus]|uniref:coiled-coil domain-containing protein 105 n=1 Tax=Lampris incognitus TaxID=2546036 RepID=UPI0024B570F2|nr:coiled-coil domain-containing protein 105 [Lampris incognitus]
MQVHLAPLNSVTVGSQPWRNDPVRSILRAGHLACQTRAGRSRTTGRPRSSAAASAAASPPKEPEMKETENKTNDKESCDGHDSTRKTARPQTTGATLLGDSQFTSVAPSSLREQCAESSVGVAVEYMRRVREAEGQLRRQAGQVTEEGTRLERERSHLEKMLWSLRNDLQVNRRSTEERSRRPSTTETERDGVDDLLVCERRELVKLKQELEGMLRDTINQQQVLGLCSRRLLDCAAERSCVLDLMPHHGSLSTGGHTSTSQTFTKADPVSPFTPGYKQALESSTQALSQSQLLREKIRQTITSAIARQRAAQHTVNHGLLKKIAETVAVKQQLTLMSVATRQAIYRKQREINRIRHNHDRSRGPESSSDLLSREKLNRPLVKVYQRHPGTQLAEAAQLKQGTAVLKRCLTSSEDEMASLQDTFRQLNNNLQKKTAATQVDSLVVRMRRRLLDRRATPTALQQGAC